MYGKYYILITFDDKIAEVKVPENPKRILGLDPGVNNFLGVANNFGGAPFVMNGRAVKSANQRFNKKRAKLISSVAKGSDSKSSVKYSKQLNILSQRRESFLRDYFYKCAWYICRYAKAAGVDVIVMGHNDGQKQEIDLKDNVNQNFVSIPYTKFITILKTVASKCGIAVVIREESYTSQASLLDMDDIPTYKKGENKKYAFSGKRIHRGLYRSKNGTLYTPFRNIDDSVNLRSPSPDTCGNLPSDDDVAKWFKAADCNSATVSPNLTVILMPAWRSW